MSEDTKSAQPSADEPTDKDARKARDLIVEIQSKFFDKSAAYTNLVMLAGYASAFTVWNFTRQLMSPTYLAWVALLLSGSLIAFVFHEIAKMLYIAWWNRGNAAVIRQSDGPTVFVADYAEHQKSVAVMEARVLTPLWGICLVLSLALAVPAIAMMLWAFIRTQISALCT